MEDLLQADDIGEREKLFTEIKHELLLHAKTEQDSFYKVLEDKKPTEERVEEAEEEHKEIEKYIKKLAKLEFNSEEWIEQFGEFKHSVTHHVKEEEGALFEKAHKVLSDKEAVEIMETMQEMKLMPKYQAKAE
jgi:hemerythrin superfamily protein